MGELFMFAGALISIYFVYVLWRSGSLRASEFNRAATTMAVLAIVLMLFVSILVLGLRG